jgi:hypothetical protein
MLRRWRLLILGGSLLGAIQCGPSRVEPGTDASGGDGGTVMPSDSGTIMPSGCGADADGDGIPDAIEGMSDADMDGTPNLRDTDADGDGRLDAAEANPTGAYNCAQRPADSDRDGNADYLDTDADGNGILDTVEFAGYGDAPDGGWAAAPVDSDRDRTPDYADLDDDGDGIPDLSEIGADPANPPDTDGDMRPDWRDVDSDGDTIGDRLETTADSDSDMIPNYRDTDSDGDGAPDRDEAINPAMMGVMRMNVDDPPFECPTEVNPADLSSVQPDGRANYVDGDSDNDGLGDREERAIGSDVCKADSDMDGQLDVVENAFCQRNMRMGCATDGTASVRMQDYYLILPFDGPIQQRELEFGTSIRVADVFFIFDTTGSMSSVQQAVSNTIASPGTGLVDSIRRIIPDTWFGVGHYDDFPTGSFGGGSDRAIHPLCTMAGAGGAGYGPAECVPSATGRHGMIVTNPMAMVGTESGAEIVQRVARAIPGGGGADGPESQVEALYQLVTNEGLYDRAAPMACTPTTIGRAPCWVKPTTCPEGTWGFGCFRTGALAIMVHYTDVPWHNGARDESPPTTTYYSPYTGITPAPHNFDQMVAAFQRRSARQVNINASGSVCEGRVYTNHGGASGPCFDMRMAAEGTGSVDVDGVPLVYDLPRSAGSGAPPAELINVVTNAVNTLATRVPLDITTTLRNDPMNPMMFDGTRFIKRRVPSCRIPPENMNCWTAPTGVSQRAAVARTDLSTFYRVVPGTRVRFTISFQNDVYEGDCRQSTLFHSYIDVVGDGVTRLDTREVFVVVPAAPASSERCGGAG